MRKRRPRIVMVSGTGPPVMDGVGDCTAGLIEALVRQRPDWDWYWVCRRARWYHAPLKSRRGLTMIRPNHSWGRAGASLAGAVVRWLRPDVLHIQEQIHSFFETDAAVRIAEAAGKAPVTTLHEFHVERPSVRHTIDLVGRSAVVIANDARNADRCREHAGREPDHRWWSANTVPPPEPSWGVTTVPGVVATFGFISSLKSLAVAFEALDRLRPAHPDLRWRIIGPFDPAANPGHAELAKGLAADWVTFTGGFPPRDRRLRTLLGEAQVMLLPFADGASPRRTTLQAAWAFGLPVVTTPPPSDEPSIVDGENCLLVREPTAVAYAEALGRVLTDRDLAARLRAGSLATAARFGWDRLAALHVAMYESLLESG